MSSEYIIAHVGPQLFTVSKFNGGEQPLEVYNIDYSQSQQVRGKSASRCDCMAWRSGKRRPCKHVDMVAHMLMRRRQYVEEMSHLHQWSLEEQALFDFTQFVCVGEGTEWRFSRSEPDIIRR